MIPPWITRITRTTLAIERKYTMAPIEKVGRTCIVAAAVIFAVGYVCSRVVSDGIWFPFAEMSEKLNRNGSE